MEAGVGEYYEIQAAILADKSLMRGLKLETEVFQYKYECVIMSLAPSFLADISIQASPPQNDDFISIRSIHILVPQSKSTN